MKYTEAEQREVDLELMRQIYSHWHSVAPLNGGAPESITEAICNCFECRDCGIEDDGAVYLYLYDSGNRHYLNSEELHRLVNYLLQNYNCRATPWPEDKHPYEY